MEDFRSDILGYLGSRPDYQDLYKRALVERDYRRTDIELQRMMEDALRAREALDSLAQDLGHSNLEHYRQLEGRLSLVELGEWARAAILKLGGGAVPIGEFWSFICPDSLQRKCRLLPKYEKVCFDRDVALRNRGSELGGVGHPLIDALLEETRSATLAGEVADLGANGVFARYLVRRRDDRGLIQSRVITMLYDFLAGRFKRCSTFRPMKGRRQRTALRISVRLAQPLRATWNLKLIIGCPAGNHESA